MDAHAAGVLGVAAANLQFARVADECLVERPRDAVPLVATGEGTSLVGGLAEVQDMLAVGGLVIVGGGP